MTKNKIPALLLIGATVMLMTKCTDATGSKPAAADYEALSANFKNPDPESGVNCWWWWLNGNVTKEAITKDLEAMKEKNFNGAMIFDAGGHNQRGNNPIPSGPLYGSKEWTELFVFALDEASRLGLDIGFNIQSGWNLGGPTVTPQHAAKQLTYAETQVEGGQTISLQLPQPPNHELYKDIAVLAFKAEEAATEKINHLNYKLSYHEMGGSAPDTRFLLNNAAPSRVAQKPTYKVKKEEVLDLSAKTNGEGLLEWDAPEGQWNVMRIGYTCTRADVSTSSEGWHGRVIDYLSKEAFEVYWNDVVEPVLAAAGGHVGTTLKYMETDSWECGGMNWTDSFAEEFKRYRNYDLTRYLPIIAGHLVDDMDASHAFLADFRKTLAHLVANNHYALFASYAHKYGMGIQPESAGPHAGPLDGIKNYGFSDIVMSEFWSPSPHRPTPGHRFFVKQAASAAHIYGKKIVGAESFTTIGPHWNDELWRDQKSSFDHEICSGVNRVYFHTFTCSPKEMGLPGQEYFAGTHVNPQVTWWNEAGAFIDYMHRTQYLVQEGKFVADVLYYYGDHVPNIFSNKQTDPAGALPGFDYDVTDETVLTRLKVKNGKIVVPGGITYRLLALPKHRTLSLEALKKVEAVLAQGGEVIGHKPEHMVSLKGGQKAQREFKRLADAIWGKDSIPEQGAKKYKKGAVAWGITAREYLLAQGVAPDVEIPANCDYIHYTIGDDTDLYFVCNQTEEEQTLEAVFRVGEKQPELWDPLTGEIRDAKAFRQFDGRTAVPLTLDPYGSVAILFNKPVAPDAPQNGAKANYPAYEPVQRLEGAWKVYFSPEYKGPGTVDFPALTDWTASKDARIKYYSGPAVYSKKFGFSPEPGDHRYVLELESVKDAGVAHVYINGTDKGTLWTKPFRTDVTAELKEGENSIEITVVNSWYNRVAGDELNPEGRLTQTNIVLKKDARDVPLEPSGLLGPVSIKKTTLLN
jgi:hypothetical protein